MREYRFESPSALQVHFVPFYLYVNLFITGHLIKSVTLCLLLLLTGLSTLAQSNGSNPAVGTRAISTGPLEKVGSVFSMTFSIGNAGLAAPISGASEVDRMGFTIQFQGCALNGPIDQAITGTINRWFDLRYNKSQNRIEGSQKSGISLNPRTFGKLFISTVVTQASSSTADYSIGAVCTIIPNASSLPVQSIDDDSGHVFTHTLETVVSDLPVNYSVREQADQTVILSWSSSPNPVFNKFVIEKSKDSKLFEPVSNVTEGVLENDKLKHFRFVDTQPFKGTSYYRLGQLDAAGNKKIHQTKVVTIGVQYGVKHELSVGEPIALALDEPESAVLHLYSSSGNEIKFERAEARDSSIQLKTIDKIERGAYVLTVEERAITRQYRFVVR